jgi:hypothetical protein
MEESANQNESKNPGWLYCFFRGSNSNNGNITGNNGLSDYMGSKVTVDGNVQCKKIMGVVEGEGLWSFKKN